MEVGPWRDLRRHKFKAGELADTSLVGSDLRGADLRGQYLSNVDLSLANLDGADLTGASMFWCTLAHASARGAALHRARLWQVRAFRSDCSAIDLTAAAVQGSSFVECRFEGVSVSEETEFTDADPTGYTNQARAFCERFGIAVKRGDDRGDADEYAREDDDEEDDLPVGVGEFFGPCDFTGSTGLPFDILAAEEGTA